MSPIYTVLGGNLIQFYTGQASMEGLDFIRMTPKASGHGSTHLDGCPLHALWLVKESTADEPSPLGVYHFTLAPDSWLNMTDWLMDTQLTLMEAHDYMSLCSASGRYIDIISHDLPTAYALIYSYALRYFSGSRHAARSYMLSRYGDDVMTHFGGDFMYMLVPRLCEIFSYYPYSLEEGGETSNCSYNIW